MSGIDDAFKHDFYPSTTVLDAKEACLDDTGVVEYQQIARFKQLRQIFKFSMKFQLTADMQQAAATAFSGRVLGDQFGR